MKTIYKTLICLGISLAFSFSVAASKPQSIGLNIGSVNGIAYRIFLTEHLAVQPVVAWRWVDTHGTTVLYPSTFTAVPDGLGWGKVRFWTVDFTPNIVSQALVHPWEWGSLYWNSGGGLNAGLARIYRPNTPEEWGGKVGINSISGFELAFNKVPITVFMESYLGYGFLWSNYTDTSTLASHFIDWGNDIGIRYTF